MSGKRDMVWAAGQRLQNGKYIIENILGEGGFGITYKARHTLLQQLMVIKTPNERLKNDPEYPKYLQRFVEEGRRLEKLSEQQHPNIVRVRDLFEERGIYCLVMDFVSGESLFDLVQRRGALPPTEAVEYVRQIGEALTVVHQARLVHRDAHPGNIMVQSNGKAVLIDFGIAGEILQTVESSKHFGNLAFAPYEQMMGSREPTVDIYCLAASLYYALTGQCPTSSLDRKLNNFRLIKPNQLANISDELNRAILKGMKLEAKNRPQSMHEWLKLLEVANRTVRVSLPPQRNILWFELAGVLLNYAVVGFFSAPSALALALAMASSFTWALFFFGCKFKYHNLAGGYTFLWAEILSCTWACACAFAWYSVDDLGYVFGWTCISVLADTLLAFTLPDWIWRCFSSLTKPCFLVSVIVLGKLNKSFSKSHQFIILLGTSWLGLGLASLLAYQILSMFR